MAGELFTHNGRFTLVNRATKEHRTFRVRTQKPDATFAPGERVVSLLTGADNEQSYTGFGFMKADGVLVWSKKRGQDGKRSAFDWYAEMLFTLVVDGGLSPFADKYELLEETVCRVCNRTLTEPESIRTGIGPICAGRQGSKDDDGDHEDMGTPDHDTRKEEGHEPDLFDPRQYK